MLSSTYVHDQLALHPVFAGQYDPLLLGLIIPLSLVLAVFITLAIVFILGDACVTAVVRDGDDIPTVADYEPLPDETPSKILSEREPSRRGRGASTPGGWDVTA